MNYPYTPTQIEAAKNKYNRFLHLESISDYAGQIEFIGRNEAYSRMDFHNSIVNRILAGDTELANEWKLFFLTAEFKADQKKSDSKTKLAANKSASSDILAPIKAAKRLVEFGNWLNTSGNQYRSQHFSKKYTVEAVNAFLNN